MQSEDAPAFLACSMQHVFPTESISEESQLAVGTQCLSDIADDHVFLVKLREKGFKIEPEKLMMVPELKPTIEQLRYLCIDSMDSTSARLT